MDLEQDHRPSVENLQAEVSERKAFLESPGWKKHGEELQAEIRSRRTSAFQIQIRSQDDCFSMAYVTAEVAGLQLAYSYPFARLREAEMELQDRLEEDRMEKEDAG